MTSEYPRAAAKQGLDCRDLKQIARDSIRNAFAPEESPWRGDALKPSCARSPSGAARIPRAQTREKAALERMLEPMMQRTLHMQRQ